MSRTDALELVARLQAIWPDRWTTGRADQWLDVMTDLDADVAGAAIIRFRSTHDKLPAIAEFVSIVRPYTPPARRTHSLDCLCGGSGWIEVEQMKVSGTAYYAWARCPRGPATDFVEPSEPFDQYAGATAHETHGALAAVAETRTAQAEACFAAARAYANAERVTLR